MTTEEAIKILKNINVLNLEEYTEDEINQAIEVVLKELDKKDKVIDEMAREFYAENIYIGYSNFCWKKSPEEVKQYFYKKVEEQYLKISDIFILKK